jgi:MoaA/NifB/PqqE/SkfB family radical SAM enzyme
MTMLKQATTAVRLAGRVVNKDGAPLHLIFFVTNRCDFSCSHCFLIASGELNDKTHVLLSLDEIDKIARSVPNLVALSLTGGEPFLRADYSEIVRSFVRHTDLKSLTSVTNGVKADRILPHLERLLAETDLSIFITVSIDGSEHAHNVIRRKPDAFARSIETIRQLKKLRKRYPRFAVGVNSTYIGTNYSDLMELYDDLENVGPDYVTLNLMRGVHWQDRPEGLSTVEYRQLNARKNELMARLTDKRTLLQKVLRAKDAVMTELIANTYEQNRSLFPCYGGQLLGILKDDGEVYACEQLSTSFGNVRRYDYDFMEVWHAETAELERQRIRAHQCHCTYECSMSPNVLFNPSLYPRVVGAFMQQMFEH